MLGALFSPIIRLFSLLKSFVVYDIRIDGMVLNSAYNVIIKDGKIYSTSNEFIKKGLPRQYDGYGYYNKLLFILTIRERLLRAGGESYDIVSNIVVFRFQKGRLLRFLQECSDNMEDEVPILLPRVWGPDKLGSIKRNKRISNMYIEKDNYSTIDSSIKRVLADPDSKTGFLLHGEPGNGKSCLVKYFALNMNVRVVG